MTWFRLFLTIRTVSCRPFHTVKILLSVYLSKYREPATHLSHSQQIQKRNRNDTKNSHKMSAILKFIRENHILALIEQAIVKKKSRLSLNAFEIIEIPELLYTCADVKHLYLHRNKITVVPVEITQLENLTTLTLDYNNISYLPPEIGHLKKLVNLNISYNPLHVLLPEIGELENLEAFWCNKIGLREIPKEIGKLTKLDTFGARGNELKTIPEEMTKLTRLR